MPARGQRAPRRQHERGLLRVRGRRAGLIALALLIAVAGGLGLARARHEGSAGPAGPGHSASGRSLAAGEAARRQAVAWVARQVSRGAVVACDRVMCSALAARGFPVGSLLVVGPTATGLPGSAVVIATADIRSQFGSKLGTSEAPDVIASFDSGSARIDIRAVASDGAAAYRTALRADLRARQASGAQLLHNQRIIVSDTAQRQLAAGEVDSRLLITIAALAARHPVRIVAFSGFAPDASPGIPLRFVDIAETGGTGSTAGRAYVRSVRALLGAQAPPYLPLRIEAARTAAGQDVLRIGFSAPSPLGLLGVGGR